MDIKLKLSYYTSIMLDTFKDLLCLKLCWHNRPGPTLDDRFGCLKPKCCFVFMTFLWSVFNICFVYVVNIQIYSHFRCHAVYLYKSFYDWWHILLFWMWLVNFIFLQLEPQNSIACNQTLIQGLGMRLPYIRKLWHR